ncbi:hypothetical protein [Paenibacillus sp. HW567]|uniref:hypothetical protein n=1 Tax=Paenibacillus sp. HW567 TaxID=1034769 RepID=UPI0003780B12|nr:hypothetical protein [Paenibacillus sp. HW567]
MSMKDTVMVCAAGLLISWREVPPLLRQKRFRELLVYVLMLGLGVWLSIIAVSFTAVPTPLHLIELIFQPVLQMLKYVF